jgi:hypothetical protein
MWLGVGQRDPTIYEQVYLVSLNHSMTILQNLIYKILQKHMYKQFLLKQIYFYN